MFKEVTNLQDILVYGEAGLLWDSWFIRESDTCKDTYGEMVWDDPQHIEACLWNPDIYELGTLHSTPDAPLLYKFYIYLED